MRNLIAFLLRYQGVLLFVLLEVVSLFLFITNSSYQRAAFFNSANAYAGTVLARRTEVADYFRLGELNQELLAENTRLRQQLYPPDFARREADSLPVGRDTLGRILYRHLRPYPAALARPATGSAVAATGSAAATTASQPPATAPGRYPEALLLGGTRQPTHDPDYPMVPARVVNNSLRSVDNYLTLNVGTADGVTPGLGVLAPAGVVGRVKSVSQHYATVTSLLHSKTAVAARLKRDGTFGSLVWDGDDYRYARLDYVPRQNKLVRGDTVVTSGYNAVFPSGVFIGTVANFVKEPDKNFWTVQVQLGVDFSRLTYVYVVHNRPRAERDSLETALTTEPVLPKGAAPKPASPTAGTPAGPAAAPARFVPQNGLVSRVEEARREALAQARAEYNAKLAADAKARADAEKLAKDKVVAEAKKAAAAKAAAAQAGQPLAPGSPTPSPAPRR